MKRKRINKKILYSILSVVIILICTLTIAYSVLSSTLTISGSSEISGSSWNISINKVNLDERFPNSIWVTGETGIRSTHDDNSVLWYNGKLLSGGTISGTSVTDLQISLTTPGDAVISAYEVINNGSIPAMFDSATENEKTFISSSNNDADIQLISQYFNSNFALIDPSKILDVGFPTSDYILSFGEILCPGEFMYFLVFSEFAGEATAVPSSNVTISNVGATLNFVQADKNVCSNS